MIDGDVSLIMRPLAAAFWRLRSALMIAVRPVPIASAHVKNVIAGISP